MTAIDQSHRSCHLHPCQAGAVHIWIPAYPADLSPWAEGPREGEEGAPRIEPSDCIRALGAVIERVTPSLVRTVDAEILCVSDARDARLLSRHASGGQLLLFGVAVKYRG